MRFWRRGTSQPDPDDDAEGALAEDAEDQQLSEASPIEAPQPAAAPETSESFEQSLPAQPLSGDAGQAERGLWAAVP
jgi:hypothetical protein